jgi:hypothetical protein
MSASAPERFIDDVARFGTDERDSPVYRIGVVSVTVHLFGRVVGRDNHRM